MIEEFQQKTTGTMTYPKKGSLNRFLFKSPLIWWRMGLGPIMSHKSMGGYKMLALSTWGRTSKIPRHTLLSYVLVNGKEYVCSGWGARSDWYKNIKANPQVTIQVGNKVFSAKAYRVQDLDEYTGITQEMFKTGGDSHFKPWLESFDIELNQQDMIAKRDRLHLVGFEVNHEPGPPPLQADLIWVWVVMVFILIGIWFIIT
jgi:deazaflavin-dependent oxidoreductase (nitroreductase family)